MQIASNLGPAGSIVGGLLASAIGIGLGKLVEDKNK